MKDAELQSSTPPCILQARPELLMAAPSGLTNFTKQTATQGRTSTPTTEDAAPTYNAPGIRSAIRGFAVKGPLAPT